MKNISITELDSVLENGTFYENGEAFYINKNEIYSFESKEFNCHISIINGYISILDINGEKVDLSLENLSLKEIYNILLEKYYFLPSYRQHEEEILPVYNNESISFLGKQYDEVLVFNEKIYLLSTSDSILDSYEYYPDEPLYDIVECIEFDNIKNVEVFTLDKFLSMSIFAKEGTVALDIEVEDNDMFKELMNFYRKIKLFTM